MTDDQIHEYQHIIIERLKHDLDAIAEDMARRAERDGIEVSMPDMMISSVTISLASNLAWANQHQDEEDSDEFINGFLVRFLDNYKRIRTKLRSSGESM